MIDKIKRLRDETGASIAEIRAALDESGNDVARAKEALSRKFGAIAAAKAGREVRSGVVEAYVHSNARIGALAELQCETDFVARNPEFRQLAHDLAMQVTAMAPEDVAALYAQPYVKDPNRSVQEVVNEAVSRFGENIKIGNFARLEL